MLEIHIHDRNYEKWSITGIEDYKDIVINPLENKLFHKDILDENGIIIINSPYRLSNSITGVLVLDGKTYGRTSGNNSKLLYKCIPNEKCLPMFLVPYDYNNRVFNKKKINKYITFKIKEWVDKHPIAIIVETLGDVESEDAYYKYQLCCKQLTSSIASFTKATLDSLKQFNRENISTQIMNQQGTIEDRRNKEVFSIDPLNSKDFDDAIGITTIDNDSSIISIYIANVPLVIDYLQLWDHFSERIATIYLPNGKRPMLPLVLTDDLCSLMENNDRLAYSMDLCVTNGVIVSCSFKSVIINVTKNYIYEEASLIENKIYKNLLQITKTLNDKYRFVTTVTDSHTLIEFYMILTNFESSKILVERNTGIFRYTNVLDTDKGNEADDILFSLLSPEIKNTLCNIHTISGSYCSIENLAPHKLIGHGLSSYSQVTSPIRRLVDLVNLIELQKELLTSNAVIFSKRILNNISYIDQTTKNIRKVQTKCNLLSYYLNTNQKEYFGIVFNKTIYKERAYKYAIYMPQIKQLSTVKSDKDLANYSKVTVSTYYFVDEDNLSKKIRLTIC